MRTRNTGFLIPTFLSIILGVITACSSGGGDNNPNPPSQPPSKSKTVSGTAVVGPVALADVSAYAINADGSNGSLLGSTQTDSGGAFSVTLSSVPAGGVRLVVSGGSYISPANTASTVNGASLSATLSSVGDNGASGVAVTPLTAFADTLMVNSLPSAGSLSAALAQAEAKVKSIYGIQGGGTLSQLAPDFTATTGDAAVLALALGVLEQLAIDNGKTPAEIIHAIGEDIADGLLDGKTAGGGVIQYDIVTVAPVSLANTSFLSALNEYILPGNTATIIAQNSVVLDSQIVTDLINGINLNSPGITPPPAPGSLDTGFNVTGEVITPMGAGNDIANAVAVQTDGKIVAAGYSGDLVGSVFALARYNADGSLDTTFGTNGKLTTAIGSSNFSSATGVAIQADGKIIASGAWGDGGLIGALALARYNTDGSLDTTFGTDGKYAATEASGVIQAIAIQADKQILVAGGAGLARYNTDGSIDATFGTGGKVSTTVGLGYVATTVALQTDKKIITAGHYVLSNGTSHAFALVRYNTDGSLDTSFDTDGIVTTAVGTAFDIAYAIAIQGDGKIVATGTSLSGTGAYELALLRYNTDGSLDSTFGTDGKVVTGNGATADSGNGVAIQTDGKIVVTASYIVSNAGTGMAVVRYNADGSLDTAFGSNGRVSAGDGASRGIVIQGDKKIIAAGNLKNGIYYNFALARFLP